ncbi:hypothetical protein EJ05DRAFT_424285, partial [Pseudovirgaria hyperparasitica]
WKSGRHLKQIDTALPGAHVKLRSFLKKIAIEESDQCECSQGREDTRHFLLHCRRHEHLRGDVIKEGQGRYGDLSYMLGGRSPYLNPDGSSPDGPLKDWSPNLDMVRTVIKYICSARSGAT